MVFGPLAPLWLATPAGQSRDAAPSPAAASRRGGEGPAGDGRVPGRPVTVRCHLLACLYAFLHSGSPQVRTWKASCVAITRGRLQIEQNIVNTFLPRVSS